MKKVIPLEINSKLKKMIFDKLTSDFDETIFYPYKNELWILREREMIWYLQIESRGEMWYNQKEFSNFFNLFSLTPLFYQPIIKEWIEEKTKIRIRNVARKNTNYDYILADILKNKKKSHEWSLKNRFGFSFPVIKNYLDKKNNEEKGLKLKDF